MRLAAEELGGDFTRVLVSPALRARQTARFAYSGPQVEVLPALRASQTARFACSGVQAEVLPALREANFGAFEGLTADEIQSRYPDDWARYLADPLRFVFPGGDSMEDYLRDAEATTRMIAQLEGRVLAVSHKGFIAAALSTLLQGDASHLFHYDIKPAGFAALRIEGGFAVLTRLADMPQV